MHADRHAETSGHILGEPVAPLARRSAPRFSPAPDSLAAAARRAVPDDVQQLLGFRTSGTIKPFDDDPVQQASLLNSQAYALLSVITSSMADGEMIHTAALTHEALEGVSSLLALGMYALRGQEA